MTRIVLEEVFRDDFHPETGDPIKVKLGEIVIYTEQLTPEQLTLCKTWPKKHKDVLRARGFTVE